MNWGELLTQFTLGNAAILTNACLLPLYPGLIAFLAGTAQTAGANGTTGSSERSVWVTGSLGVFVLAGILTMMLLIGMALYLLSSTFDSVLLVILPIVYGLVIVLGLLMITGRNPFARLSTIQAPVLGNPFMTAFVYGLLFAPMTLPCTGPVILTAFTLGAGGTGSLLVEIIYFIGFGLGFGWPLLILPLFAVPIQRRFTGWLSRNHMTLTRASGILLIAIGLFGIATELLPNVNLA